MMPQGLFLKTTHRTYAKSLLGGEIISLMFFLEQILFRNHLTVKSLPLLTLGSAHTSSAKREPGPGNCVLVSPVICQKGLA